MKSLAKNFIKLSLILLIGMLPIHAVDKIIATVDKEELFLGDVVKLNLSISDPNLKIQFPQETEDYKVVASSVSSSFQIINGVTSQNKTISYVIQPLRAGNINLPEATATDGSNYYKSQNIVVRVEAGQKITQRPASTNPEPSKQEYSNSNNVFARIRVNNANPYVNEQINLSLKIYHRGNLAEINPGTLVIPMDDFVRKLDDKAKEYKEEVNGKEYLVYQIDYNLYPLKPGQTVIPEHEIEGIILEDAPLRRSSFDPFRMMNPFILKKPVRFKTNSLTINTKPVPKNHASSFSGYVGELAINHQVSSLEVKAGDAITLTTKIYGNGSAGLLGQNLVKESKQYSLFKDSETINEQINHGMIFFEKIISTAIIPEKDSGKIAIETLPIVSFNPKTGSFEEHGKESFEINILPGEGGAKAKRKQQENEKEIKEILVMSKDQVQSYKAFPPNSQLLLLLLAIVNLIFFAIKFFTKANNSDSESISIKAITKEINSADSIAQISKLFKEYSSQFKLEDKADLKEKIKNFTNETDMFNYSGMHSETEKIEYFKKTACELIKELK